jgi:hypothetical protein
MSDAPELAVRVTSPASVIAIVPHLLGFVPANSLVVIGMSPPRGRVSWAARYDLDHEPERIAEHAIDVITKRGMPETLVIGYGPGPTVTPATDALRRAASQAGAVLQDILRVHEGRYWSYICQDPVCCPPDGIPFDTADPAAQALTDAGMTALPSRADLARSIAPVTGSDAEQTIQATHRAQARAARLLADGGQRAVDRAGLTAVRAVIGAYRRGSSVGFTGHALLAVTLTSLPVRDDAWARMDPTHRKAHLQLWTDATRRARPGYIAAPASLLAFTAWQSGEGALANLALERALDDYPGYSMAHLIGQAIDAGLPPASAQLPMTPEEVADSYTGLYDS